MLRCLLLLASHCLRLALACACVGLGALATHWQTLHGTGSTASTGIAAYIMTRRALKGYRRKQGCTWMQQDNTNAQSLP
jgi:hypothetical protein